MNASFDINAKDHINLILCTQKGEDMPIELKSLFDSIFHANSISKINSNIFMLYKKNRSEETNLEKVSILLNELLRFIEDNNV